MMTNHAAFGAAVVLLAAAPAAAQDASGVFDMGQLTGTLAQDHVTQHERARARARGDAPPARSARNARYCANIAGVRARHGAAKAERLAFLCRRAGYPTG